MTYVCFSIFSSPLCWTSRLTIAIFQEEMELEAGTQETAGCCPKITRFYQEHWIWTQCRTQSPPNKKERIEKHSLNLSSQNLYDYQVSKRRTVWEQWLRYLTTWHSTLGFKTCVRHLLWLWFTTFATNL